ncbi:MAG: type II toxin-antitoxin system VapC family toxin [Acidobacteria bacterium]|nr:type II toxin-antitoxin system VapC family toxin [Acidobacteriota bacterium]MCI0720618.1 type II toxin-antitoxin system VapC family toxin [Acidobacteriota bacterium]
MNGSFVVDASVGFAWVHPGQATEQTDKLLDAVEAGSGVVVPGLWLLEVANALLVAVRRKKMTDTDRKVALEYLGRLSFSVDQEAASLAFGKISELANRHGLSVYDATYLELAMRRALPLASKDSPLRRAAKKSGIKVL